MSTLSGAVLVARAWYELARFDLLHALIGFRAVIGTIPPLPAADEPPATIEPTVVQAVLLASCLYWKPVRCLQRSVCTTSLLRRRGVPARLVIGYRLAPFRSHAWVELDGRVVNDSPVYKQRLHVLHTV
jgi:hypothetical protein